MAFTQEQVDAHNARVMASRESYALRVARRSGKTMEQHSAIASDLAKPDADVVVMTISKTGVSSLNVKRIEPKKKELMNKTEKLWHAELLRRNAGSYGQMILCQAITIRLGDRLSYRPDFAVFDLTPDGGRNITFYETKAPHRFATAGLTKVKSAAALCPWARFVFVMRDKNQWVEKKIGRE